MIDEVFDLATERAALEAFGGSYSPEKLLELIDVKTVKNKAIDLINCDWATNLLWGYIGNLYPN